mmetsp:Transcript_121910/g.379488  ORF Transcript_121910/g.379488 Transcript_121910/m.379488 type:complete len:206 (+) Transcript_121910:92-709(+)
MAVHVWSVRTNHSLCAVRSTSDALVSLHRCAKRVSESTLPRLKARPMGATGNSNAPRKATTDIRPKMRQCLGGGNIGDKASLMNVDNKFGGLAAGPAEAALTFTVLAASTAKQRSAPKEVVKTKNCSQARMPHHVAQQAHRLISSSRKPASTHRVARAGADALAACTQLSFARAAPASRVSPSAAARVASAASCSAISFCRARLG